MKAIELIFNLVLVLSTSLVFGQSEFNYAQDFDSFLLASNDSASGVFYPRLLERFQLNDSTLTDEEVLIMMIGFTTNENYLPYLNADKEREILNLIGSNIYEEALSKCETLLATNPFNFTALMEKGFALWKLEDSHFEVHKSKYFKVLNAILYSGDGSFEKPMFTLSPHDGQMIVRYVLDGAIGTKGSGRDEYGNFLEILEMIKDGKTSSIYFSIEHAVRNSEWGRQIDNVIEGKD